MHCARLQRSRRGRQWFSIPLDVRRPDVAADYPDIPDAGTSGFAVWAPVHIGSRGPSTSRRLLASGQSVPLAQFEATLPTAFPRAQLPGTASIAGTGFRHHRHPTWRYDIALRVSQLRIRRWLPRRRRSSTSSLTASNAVLTGISVCFRLTLPPGVITGEATPYALFHPLSATATADGGAGRQVDRAPAQPGRACILALPLERARGDETLDFAAALDAEAERLAGEEASPRADPAYVSRPHKHDSYIARGEYVRQLERWFERLPAGRTLVVRSEDLYARPAADLRSRRDLPGIDPRVEIPFTVAQSGVTAPPLHPAIARRLGRALCASRCCDSPISCGWDPSWP